MKLEIKRGNLFWRKRGKPKDENKLLEKEYLDSCLEENKEHAIMARSIFKENGVLLNQIVYKENENIYSLIENKEMLKAFANQQ